MSEFVLFDFFVAIRSLISLKNTHVCGTCRFVCGLNICAYVGLFN